MNSNYAYVMMIQPNWWKQLQCCNREGQYAHAYVSFGNSPPKNTSFIFFYVTKPVGEIAGYAEFVERIAGSSDELWSVYGKESAFENKRKYDIFVKDRKKIVFIRFKDLHEAARPMSYNDLQVFFGKKRMPRRGFYISKVEANQLTARLE